MMTITFGQTIRRFSLQVNVHKLSNPAKYIEYLDYPQYLKLSANDEINTTFDDAVGEYKIVPGAVIHGRPFYVHKDDASLVMLYAGEYFFYMKHKT